MIRTQAQEQLIRKVTGIGNGAHIFAPKDWLGEEVFIVRAPKKSLKEKILSVLDPYLEHIEGAYLYGSQAREEATPDSDIDLFVITNKKLKIKKRGFEIIAIEKKDMPKAIKIAPTIIYSALAESKPIINAKLLKELREKYKPKLTDFKEYLEDTKRIISINKEFLEEEKARHIKSEAIPYSLILRLRGVFIILELLKYKSYSHKKFRKWITSKMYYLDYNSIYKAYINAKTKEKGSILKRKDLGGLLSILEKETNGLREKIYDKKKKAS